MSYKAGDEVIVTSEGVNRVAVILDRRVINKSHNARNFINKTLTEKLCESGVIQSTIPYKDLVANEQLPHLDANSAGKASW